jgi:hypothetical protein
MMGGLTRKRARALLLVICAGFVVTLIGDWTRSTPPALVDLAIPPKGHVAGMRAPLARDSTLQAAPEVELDRLGRRASRGPASDPFEPHGWTEPREKPREVAVVQAAPQAPPLPFTYLGKWTERERVAIVLAREGRNYIAHVDEIIDGTYRVDSIESNRVTMTFLPLGAQQTLVFEQGGGASLARVVPQARADRADDADVVLHITMPAQAAAAEEFTIMLSLDPRRAAMVERGSVELAYDPKVLNVISAGTKRMSTNDARPDPGRVSLDLAGGYIGHSGPTLAIRVRVVATAPTTTQLRLASLLAFDNEGRNLAVAVDGANPHLLTIASAAGNKQAAEARPILLPAAK